MTTTAGPIKSDVICTHSAGSRPGNGVTWDARHHDANTQTPTQPQHRHSVLTCSWPACNIHSCDPTPNWPTPVVQLKLQDVCMSFHVRMSKTMRRCGCALSLAAAPRLALLHEGQASPGHAKCQNYPQKGRRTTSSSTRAGADSSDSSTLHTTRYTLAPIAALAALFNLQLTLETKAKTCGVIAPIYKKSDPTEPQNYIIIIIIRKGPLSPHNAELSPYHSWVCTGQTLQPCAQCSYHAIP
jgi:hypothetical protein